MHLTDGRFGERLDESFQTGVALADRDRDASRMCGDAFSSLRLSAMRCSWGMRERRWRWYGCMKNVVAAASSLKLSAMRCSWGLQPDAATRSCSSTTT